MTERPDPASKRAWFRRPELTVPPTTECRGCGREIDLSGLRPYRRFYCRVCAQMMRTNAKQFSFRFTPRHRRRQRIGLYLLLGILLIFPVWAMDRMTHRSAAWQAAKLGLVPAVWAVGIAGTALFRWLRPLSNDIQYWSGVLLVISNAERFALNGLGTLLDSPFALPPPWFGIGNGVVMLIFLPLAYRIWPKR